VFDMYGDCYENLLENLAVVIILNPVSSVCGYAVTICVMCGCAHACVCKHKYHV